MHVKVTLLGDLRPPEQQGTIGFDLPEDVHLSGLIDEMGTRYGEALKERILHPQGTSTFPLMRIMINGRDYQYVGGFDAQLNEGDTVVFMPPIAGG